jgi:hypothetical protein
MNFNTKSYLKSTRNHTAKQDLCHTSSRHIKVCTLTAKGRPDYPISSQHIQRLYPDVHSLQNYFIFYFFYIIFLFYIY